MCRKIVAHHDNEGKFGQHPHRREVADRIVGELCKQARVNRHVGIEARKQRVTVCRRIGRRDGTENGACAGTVLDDEWLAELYCR
jgi:hypothetical protein